MMDYSAHMKKHVLVIAFTLLVLALSVAPTFANALIIIHPSHAPIPIRLPRPGISLGW
jgi:hypothetical protein